MPNSELNLRAHGCAPHEFASLRLPSSTFGIQPADTEGNRNTATALLNRMYSQKGYGTGFSVNENCNQMTLVASDYERRATIGTLTVSLDKPAGLLADALYKTEVQRLRDQGSRLCEMIKFAVDRTVNSVNSKHLLAALFHVAFIYARPLNASTDLLVEVTPQHARFYMKLLHFEVVGAEKLNPRVNTRGLLLRLRLDHAAEQIRRFGGRGNSCAEKSLYPYAFSPTEERTILGRMGVEEESLAAA